MRPSAPTSTRDTIASGTTCAPARSACATCTVASYLACTGQIGMQLLLPQQALLYLAAWGGLQAILEGEYADGVTRPYSFILTDQLPMMLFALIHTIAILEIPWQTEAE